MRNLDQANSLLATFDRQAEEAAAVSASTRQEILEGCGRSRNWCGNRTFALRLMSGLREQLNSLIDVRKECHKLNDDTAASDGQAELFIRQNDAIVGDLARNSLATVQQARQDIIARSNEPCPRLADAAATPHGDRRRAV